jgi:hypothetical protein
MLGLAVAGMASLWLFAPLWRRAKRTAEPGDPDADLMIVPRTVTPAYHFFLQAFGRENSLKVVVDRRNAERRWRRNRLVADRRGNDRRGAEPVTWHRDGFIFAPASHMESTSSMESPSSPENNIYPQLPAFRPGRRT